MMNVVAEVKNVNSHVILVQAGWSGLTTCPLVYDKIFRRFEEAEVTVQVHVFSGEPSQFFEVNPQQVRSVLLGNSTLDDTLEGSIKLFIEHFYALHAARLQVSAGHQVVSLRPT
jgi:hypothetical protein